MAVGSRSDFFDTHCSPAPTGICLHCSSLVEQSVYKWMVYYITSNPSEYKHARIFSLLCAISSLVAFLLSNKFQRVKVDTQSLFYVFQVAVFSYTLFGSV